jgi:AcrR family transcriptional regulator
MNPANERPTGRPRTIDPDRVSLIALRLFDERGFDDVSMDDVAAAAEVSRRSLFRLFPSKAALVWGGLDESADRFRASLAGSAPDDDLWDVIRTAYAAAVDVPAEMLEVTRHRLHVIQANPALAVVGASTIGAMTDAAVRFASERDASPSDALQTAVRAHALAGASSAALFWWALHGGDESPVAVVRRAFALVSFDETRPSDSAGPA